MTDDNVTTPDPTPPAAEPVPPSLPTAEANPDAVAIPPVAALAAPVETTEPATAPAELAPVEATVTPAEPVADVAPTAAVEPQPSPEAPPVPTVVAAESPPTREEPPPLPPEAEVAPAPAPKRGRKPKAAPAVAAVTTAPDATAELVAVATTVPDTLDASVAVAAAEPAAAPVPESKKKWYAVKIQSGREDSIKAAIERKVKIEALEEFFGQIVIPVEEVTVMKKVRVKNKKTGETTTQEKKVTKYNKKYPGYLFAEIEFNDEILYVFRETSGVGDFVGVTAKRTQGAWERPPPNPMPDHEVQSMLTGAPNPKGPQGRGGKRVVKLDVEKGDKVRIKNGAFAGNEGEVKAVTEAKDPTDSPKVTVEVTIWGRPVPIELDYWEVDKV